MHKRADFAAGDHHLGILSRRKAPPSGGLLPLACGCGGRFAARD